MKNIFFSARLAYGNDKTLNSRDSMKLTTIGTFGPHNIRGPQPHNPQGPYCDDATIETCRKDFFKVLSYFEEVDIRHLIRELQAGQVNGSFAETDLLGTITRIPRGPERMSKRLELYRLIERPQNGSKDSVRTPTSFPFEYWFRQIAGDKTTGQAEQIKRARRKRHAARKSIRGECGADSPLLRLLESEERQEKASVKICLFTQMTVAWCNRYIKENFPNHRHQLRKHRNGSHS